MNMNTLKDIVESGTTVQKRQLQAKIVTDGFAPATAYAYITGTRTPRLLYQMNIQKYVIKIYGKTIPLAELFPNNKH